MSKSFEEAFLSFLIDNWLGPVTKHCSKVDSMKVHSWGPFPKILMMIFPP